MEDVPEALLEAAMAPPMKVARGSAREGLRDVESYLLLTQPGPRAAAAGMLARPPVAEVEVTSLALDELTALEASLPAAKSVVGVGGGMVIDSAKYVAWRRAIPLYLVPTSISVDASVTNTVASRQGGRVEYVGFVVAAGIFFDPDVIRTAPARINRAGVGDILSIHTGSWDWRLGAEAGRARLVPSVHAAARDVLTGVESRAAEVFALTDMGIETIATAFRDVNALCLEVGHSQPEEGSEHYFAYRLEDVVGHGFLHGEVIGLGAVLMAHLQENDPARVVDLLRDCGIEWRPEHLGVSLADVAETLRTLPSFVRGAGLPYSVIDAKLSADVVPALLRLVEG